MWRSQKKGYMPMPTLADPLSALRDKYDKMLKPNINEKMERNIEELRSDGSMMMVLQPGQKAPSFALSDQNGARVSSADLLVKGPLVVSFFRGTWCPYCNEEIAALADAYPQIRKAGAELVAISPQSAKNARPYRNDHPVPFPILVDGDFGVAKAFGVAHSLPDYLQDLYKNVFENDLTQVNASGEWRLPIPSRFVIAPNGTIVTVQSDPDYRYRPDPATTIAVLAELTAAQAR
jgi:peroxiredoxin